MHWLRDYGGARFHPQAFNKKLTNSLLVRSFPVRIRLPCCRESEGGAFLVYGEAVAGA